MTDDVKERVDVAVRNACYCGLTHDGQLVFCDDPRLIGESGPYGEPLHRKRCDCREIGKAALSALCAGDEIGECVLVPKASTNARTDALLEAEHAIVAREASYPSGQRSGIAATRLAALTVRRLRIGEAATTYDGHVVVPLKLLSEAHAVMRACGWHLAPASDGIGDGVLNLAAAEIEEKVGALLGVAGEG